MERSLRTGRAVDFAGENSLRDFRICDDRTAEPNEIQFAALQRFDHGCCRAKSTDHHHRHLRRRTNRGREIHEECFALDGAFAWRVFSLVH